MKFADTSWWVAWSLPVDRRHEEAVSMVGMLRSTERVLTTNHVVGETWTFLRRRAGHAVARRFVDRIAELGDLKELTVHRVSDEEEVQAWKWLRRHDERNYSFVDATSFAVMRERRMREALAFDGDFSAAGFVELRP